MLDIQINRIQSGAVCKEIGERLSVALGPQSSELPTRLLRLMKQLAEDDLHKQPSKIRWDLNA